MYLLRQLYGLEGVIKKVLHSGSLGALSFSRVFGSRIMSLLGFGE